jgi:hypothetical protein
VRRLGRRRAGQADWSRVGRIGADYIGGSATSESGRRNPPFRQITPGSSLFAEVSARRLRTRDHHSMWSAGKHSPCWRCNRCGGLRLRLNPPTGWTSVEIATLLPHLEGRRKRSERHSVCHRSSSRITRHRNYRVSLTGCSPALSPQFRAEIAA